MHVDNGQERTNRAIWVDDTGLTCFDTRASVSAELMSSSGYGVVDEQWKRELPPPPAGASFGEDEREKYRQYREDRAGSADFVPLEGEFRSYLDDVYSSDPVPREALTDECEVLVIGAGFAGLMLWYRLQEAGFRDVRFCEKGGDVGGTWYWNRYPGVACDVEAYSYLPLLDEMGYVPSMKFASGFEIYDYCQRLAERFGFYDRCLFHTTVEATEWSEDIERWVVRTDRGDAMKARYVVLANGILTTPKLARIDGMETFEGQAFHTSRWRYDVDLTGKRVGVIGTGATAVQVIPEIAKAAEHLYVFQRTPSTVDVRDQRETTESEIDEWSSSPGWARARRARFAQISEGRSAMKAHDDYLAGRVDNFKEVKQHSGEITPDELVAKRLDSNYRIMEQIRARVDAIVEDPATADALKPWYPYGCKRPTFHDEYLPTFNRANVTLVDTAPTGVTQIDERGVVHDGTSYELDVLIYATGFYWMGTGSFNMIKGRSGETLREKWDRVGTRTFLGLHSHDFPNLFIVTGPQGGGGSFNFTDAIEAHTVYVTTVLSELRDRGKKRIEVREDAEIEWADFCRQVDIQTAPLRNCGSYYNGYGEAEPGSLGYYGGAAAWNETRDAALEDLEPFDLRD